MKQQNKSSIYVAFFTLISRVFGLIRISFISAYFGVTSDADILNRILTIPNNLRKIFAEGSLSNAYMSVFKVTVQDSTKSNVRSQAFFSELLCYIGIITAAITALLAFFSPQLISFFFQWNSAEEASKAATLFSLVIPFLFFITISVILSGLLQTHKKFVLVAISPMLHSLLVIICIFFFHDTLGIYAVAVGFLLGSLLQVLVLIIPLMNMGYAVIPKVHSLLPSKEIRLVFQRYAPSIFAVLLTVISQQIIFYLSSKLEVGDSSLLGYAIVFWQLPIGICINSITSVAFVYLVSAYEDNRVQELKECIKNTINNLLIITVPISILFFFYAHAGVSLAIQRGALGPEAAYLVARIVRIYGMSLPLLGGYLFFQRILYAMLRYKLVLFYVSIFCIIDLALSFFLANTALRIEGIAYAYGISLLCIIPLMYISISSYVSLSYIVMKGIKVMIASLPLIVVSFVCSLYTAEMWFAGSTWRNSSVFLVICVISLLCIWGGYRLLGIDIFSALKARKRVSN